MADGLPWFAQSGYDVMLEWGPTGLDALKPYTDVMIIVDVLSFTTSVVRAVERGRGCLCAKTRSQPRWATRPGGALKLVTDEHGELGRR